MTRKTALKLFFLLSPIHIVAFIPLTEETIGTVSKQWVVIKLLFFCLTTYKSQLIPNTCFDLTTHTALVTVWFKLICNKVVKFVAGKFNEKLHETKCIVTKDFLI